MGSAPLRVLASGGALLLATLGAATAGAEPLPRLAVHRTADVGDCADAAALATAVERQMKRPALAPIAAAAGPGAGASPAGTAGIELQLYRSADGYTAVLTAAGKTRTIADAGKTCAGLSAALAITLAILLDTESSAILAAQGSEARLDPGGSPGDPSRSGSEGRVGAGGRTGEGRLGAEIPGAADGRVRPQPEPEAGAELARAAALEEPPVALAPPALPRAVLLTGPDGPSAGDLSLELDLTGAAGLLHAPTLGLTGSVELRVARFLTVAAGAFWLPTQRLDLPPGDVDLDLDAGFLRACFLALGKPRAANASLCLQPSFGALRGQGSGFSFEGKPSQGSSTLPWFALGADAQVDAPLWGPFHLVARGGAVVPVTRDGFLVQGLGTAFDPPAAGALFDAGFRVTIW